MNFESLKKSSQFNRVFKKGKSVVTKYVVMYYLDNGEAINRVGLSVSKKVGNSVVRNRSKRLLRESFRLNNQMIKPGYDIVFIARVRMKDADYQTVEKSMIRLLKTLER